MQSIQLPAYPARQVRENSMKFIRFEKINVPASTARRVSGKYIMLQVKYESFYYSSALNS
jgi:hypothetical protein